MGLKNTNYKIGHNTYDNVYAVFNGNIRKIGNSYQVFFNIDTKREFALTDEPLKTVSVIVNDWDRKSDLIALAYQKGKEQLKDWKEVNGKPEVITVDNVFTGWTDDIQK